MTYLTPKTPRLFRFLSRAATFPLALGLLFALPACDSNDDDDDLADTGFARFDTDRDAQINQDEFSRSFDRMGDFTTFDADRGGDLNQGEFNTGTFGVFDTDNSGDVSEAEFNAGNTFFRSGAGQQFRDFDTDQSGRLNANEFNAAAAAGGGFDLFDADRSSTISGAEFSRGVFGSFDRDASGGISEAEFDAGSGFFDVNRRF